MIQDKDIESPKTKTPSRVFLFYLMCTTSTISHWVVNIGAPLSHGDLAKSFDSESISDILLMSSKDETV
jgi:hypothetical protein